MVYDNSVNSLEIIASELNQGDCNLSRSPVFSFPSPKRGGRSVLSLLNRYFDEQTWRFYSPSKGKKVGENQNKLACGMHLPATTLTRKNEVLKKYLEIILLQVDYSFGGFFKWETIVLPPPSLSTNTPGWRYLGPKLYTHGQQQLGLGLLHKTSNFMAKTELLWIHLGLNSFCYRQVTNILQVTEMPHLLCV